MDIDKNMTVHYQVTKEEKDLLWNGIFEYNTTIGPMLDYPPYEPFSILIRDDRNEVVAGILTKIYLKCIFVELLWVNDKHRKSGIGSKLLLDVEKTAKEKGCNFIHLDTFSFQAIDFYKKQGYIIFATIEDYPDDNKRYFLKKYL
ncbi:GCN5-related N-acetyltransferase [Paludibacter propionicigenes WB4]|uniref:GCN5-related N-acetyltransferase n=1 Tax=Paludibacter propionicigenes (strain DSM 17365 / JCM 13257 / WB4) TaxID=694427 RepID=E4T266_PALPW|nr:GNAT family N-acetyltransferase [Paludibacter propionicigenes]ADQ78810.1 GCN5-related N-acetyltransferase [Paludibacter propionicigenes WB4]